MRHLKIKKLEDCPFYIWCDGPWCVHPDIAYIKSDDRTDCWCSTKNCPIKEGLTLTLELEDGKS